MKEQFVIENVNSLEVHSGDILTVDKKYREIKSLNQSYLKAFVKNPQFEGKDENKGMYLGKAFELYLEDKTAFEKTYYVSNSDNKPSEAVVEIVDTYYQNLKANGCDEIHGEILFPIPEYLHSMNPTSLKNAKDLLEISRNYRKNYKDENKLAYLNNNGATYFQMLVKSDGKTIIGADDYASLMKMEQDVHNLLKIDDRGLKHKICGVHSPYEINESFLPHLPVGPLCMPQFAVYANLLFSRKLEVNDFKLKMNWHEVKGMIDYVIIDRKAKTIQGFDLKTMAGNTSSFPYSFYKYGYNIQAAWYQMLLGIVLKEEFPTFKLLPFQFIVVSSDTDCEALFYTVSEKTLEKSTLGFNKCKIYFDNDGNLIHEKAGKTKGICDLLDEYFFIIENCLDKPFDHYKNKNTYEL